MNTAERFRFGQIDLHGICVAWDLDAGMRVASHEYIKRNGGECEPQGAKQKRFSFQCSLMGQDLNRRLQDLVAQLEQQPREQLIHPRLGQRKACYDTLRASENSQQAEESIDFTLTFLEDQADESIASTQKLGPQQQAARVTEASTSLTTATAARFSDSTNAVLYLVVTRTNELTAAADKFVIAALEAAQSTQQDPALAGLLGRVLLRRDALLTALTATLLDTLEPDVSLTRYREAARQVYASSLELYSAVISQKPTVIPWPVPTAMPLTLIAQRLYGKDARGKMDELRLLNPHLKTPMWIPVGTTLLVSAPEVRQ